MKTLLIDLETKSDLPIKDVGSYCYMDDPSFGVLLFACSCDEAPAVSSDLTAGEEIPKDIEDAIYDPQVLKLAWNCSFERYGLQKLFGRYCDPAQWVDVMVVAANCGLPLGLEQCCEALHLPEDKAKLRTGHDLIREFCCPVKPTKKWGMKDHITPDMDPENWKLFKKYNLRDVDTELLIWQMLKTWTPDDTEHRFWMLDARINERGVRIDREMVSNAMEMDARYKAELAERATVISGIKNPNSAAQVKQWLLEQEDMDVPSLNKKVVADVVAGLKTDEAKHFMAVRTELAKASTKKYAAYLRCTSEENPHVRGCFQFYGGHTGRFAGRLVQLQNLPGNRMPDLDEARQLVRLGDYEGVRTIYPSVTGVLSELLRTAMIAEPGERFLVADFSAIEARVSAWIAGEENTMEEFRGEGLIYEKTASMMFHVPKDDIRKGGAREDLRKKGKIATLACGYGGGVNSLLAFGADKMGMTNEEMVQTVDLWRKANPRIVQMWASLEKAMSRCIVHRATTVDKLGGIRFRWDGGYVFMRLPSGREMAYCEPRYEESMRKNGKLTISYMGIEQKTRKWKRIETWGGRVFENCWAAGTPVFTDSGWKPIESITRCDKVWDGEEFVASLGAVRRGKKELICLDGLLVTPDHRVMTERGWTRAEDCDGLHRYAVRLPSDTGPIRKAGFSWKAFVDSLTGYEEPVYDILNCGPRHRYVVRGRNGAILAHNCVQAVARDCLRDTMMRLDQNGFCIRAHVHDEIICSEPTGGKTVQDMLEIFAEPIPWAAGLPLKGAGYETLYYIKD